MKKRRSKTAKMNVPALEFGDDLFSDKNSKMSVFTSLKDPRVSAITPEDKDSLLSEFELFEAKEFLGKKESTRNQRLFQLNLVPLLFPFQLFIIFKIIFWLHHANKI